MSSSLNKCTFIGNVGKQPEIRSMQSGKDVATLSIACSEDYKDKEGNKQTKTEWIKVACFNDSIVKFIQNYVNKGSKVYVEGALQTRKYTNESGDQYVTEVVIAAFNGKFMLLDNGGKSDEEPNKTEYKSAKPTAKPAPKNFYRNDDVDDEIPF